MRAAHSYLVSLTAFLVNAFLPKAILTAATVSLVVYASGCSTNTPAFEGIANRGIMPVSPQSPYMGSNVFLGQEMENSLYLYNFIKSRGAPQAIQVQGDSELDSELLMFYAREREYYAAIARIEPQTKTREWIIRGPFPITREHYPHVTHLDAGQPAIFDVFGRREVFGGPGKAAESRVIQPAFIPTPTPQPVKRHPKRVTTSSEEKGSPAVTVQGTPMNLDQEALFESRRTPAASRTAAQATPAAAAPTGRPTIDDALKSTLNPTTLPVAPSAH
jgi:hypothetical protein